SVWFVQSVVRGALFHSLETGGLPAMSGSVSLTCRQQKRRRNCGSGSKGASTMSAATADIGLIGLAVMGENLVLNMESHGYTVAVFNRTTSKVDEFLAGRGKGKKF